MVIDILTARNNIESLVKGIASGTGVSFGEKEIIIYISDYTKEAEIRNRIGTEYQGFKLRFVYSGKVQFLQPDKFSFQ